MENKYIYVVSFSLWDDEEHLSAYPVVATNTLEAAIGYCDRHFNKERSTIKEQLKGLETVRYTAEKRDYYQDNDVYYSRWLYAVEHSQGEENLIYKMTVYVQRIKYVNK